MDDDREIQVAPLPDHRHYDTFCETTAVGQTFATDFDGTAGVRRRLNTRLAVTRNAWIEPLGTQREAFYEMRLLRTLAWFCPEKPVQHEDGVEWHFRWAKPSSAELRGGVVLPDIDLYLGRHHISFERLCQETDDSLSHWRYGLVCRCCAGHFKDGEQCGSCKYAVGFHRCGHPDRDTDTLLWRKNSLFGGPLDVQRVLYNLHKKGVPVPVLRQRAEEFIAARLITDVLADQIIQTIEQMRGSNRLINEVGDADGAHDPSDGAAPDRSGVRLSREQLVKELADREEKLQSSTEDGVTDQYRCHLKQSHVRLVSFLRRPQGFCVAFTFSANTGTVSTSTSLRSFSRADHFASWFRLPQATSMCLVSRMRCLTCCGSAVMRQPLCC